MNYRKRINYIKCKSQEQNLECIQRKFWKKEKMSTGEGIEKETHLKRRGKKA